MLKSNLLLILGLFLLLNTDCFTQESKISHEVFAAAGPTQPIRPLHNDVGIYQKKYNTSFVAKIHYSVSFKRVGIGIEGSYFRGRLVETEHITFDGNSSAYSLTFPLSIYLYTNNRFRLSIYGALGVSQFNTPEITRIKMLGGEPDNSTFPSEVENIWTTDLGSRVHFRINDDFFAVGTLDYHAFIGIFQTSINLPQLSLGLGYSF